MTRMMQIFFNDFQLNFLKILSRATLLYESYSFDSRDSCSSFLNTNDTNNISLDFQMDFLNDFERSDLIIRILFV